MGVAFKVDEDLPREIGLMLRKAGHDALSVLEQGLTGAADTRVWEVSQSEGRCILTADKGFGDITKLTAAGNPGIILLHLPRESRNGYIRLVEAFLSKFDLDAIHGAIISVSPEAIRVRRPSS